jgi:uncharacterized protein (TIGR02145 family)
MRKLLLTTAAVAAAICLAGCSKKPALESVSETPDTFTDERDGQKYRTVKIGNQTWMAENLNYLPEDGGGWSCRNYGESAYDGCWCYGRSADSCKKYGMLYDWITAVEVCPVGYHLPSNEEWDELLMAVGSGREKLDDEDDEPDEYRPVDGLGAGKKLKAKNGWAFNDCKTEYEEDISDDKNCRIGDGNGTDKYGFSALPGGAYASMPGDLSGAGRYGGWWAASEEDYGAHFRYMRYYTDDVGHGTCPWPDARSVRCVADNKRHDDSVRTALIARDKEWREKLEKISGYFTDSRDGRKYRTVVIDGKTWMAENLNYEPPMDSSWCYNNVDSNCVKYGRLYDWNSARKVCPAGYHLPSNKEWDALGKAAGGERGENGFGNYCWYGAGKKLTAKSGWKNYRGEKGIGTDDFGFSGLPGGARFSNVRFVNAGYRSYWWTATEIHNAKAYIRIIDGDGGLDEYGYDKNDGLSVRCVADRP